MEATMLQDRRCECPVGAHSPLCRVGWAELPTERAEKAATAAAKIVKTASRAEKAKKFGSGNAKPRRIHRAGEIHTSLSMAEMAHGRVLEARRNVDAARAYVSQCEREFDRMPSFTIHEDMVEARAELSRVEAALLAQINAAQTIAAVAENVELSS
jgi:hypothetical protein